jgi:hypothetical protein
MTTGFELLPFLVPTALAVVCLIALFIKGKK